MARALLGVYRHLELEQQVGAIVGHAASWAGLPYAWGFAAGDETPAVLAPIVQAHAGEAPAPPSPRSLHAHELTEWGVGRPRRLEPPVPLVDGDAWEGAPPPVGVGWLLAGPSGQPAVVLLLAGEAEPAAEVMDRIDALIGGAAGAVANALHLRAVRRLVILDDVAACYNRRHFEQSIQEELSRASRFRAPVSLIFFDMDNLKQVNSLFGHTLGSRSLWEVSSRVRAKIRKFDKLFRYGGDEFCIVLPETEWHGALEVAERVREAIAGHPFLVGHTPDGAGIRMTASFGIASFPLHARTGEELVKRADRAMQAIKNGTKNSIAIAEMAGGAHAG